MSTTTTTSRCVVPRQHFVGVRSIEQRTRQLRRSQRHHHVRHVFCPARGEAALPAAHSPDSAMRTPQQPDQAATASGNGGSLEQRARKHLEDMRHEDSFAAGIWEAQAAITDAITSNSSMDGDRLFQLEADERQLFFPGKDGLSSFDIDVYKGHGQKLVGMVAPRSVVVSPFSRSPPDSMDGKFALGGRVNAYVSSQYSYAPNLDIELYHWPWCSSLFMYLNLVPRRSLLQFLEDIERMYQTRYEGCEVYQDLFTKCEQRCKDSKWQRFTSKDPFVRALAGGNSMMYQMPATPENLAEVKSMAKAVSQIWQALMVDGVMPHWATEDERAALEQTDRQLRGWAARDPDAEKAALVVGQDGFDKMMALLIGKFSD